MNYVTDSGLHVETSDLWIARGSGMRRREDERLADAARLILHSDLHATGHASHLEVGLLMLLKTADEQIGADGNRYELALIDLLARTAHGELHDAVQQTFLHASSNTDVLDSLSRGQALRAVGLVREKASATRGGAIAESADDIGQLLDAEAKLITPASGAKFTALLPAVDRGRSEGSRLDVLLQTRLGSPLPGYPSSSDRLHHADLLIGSSDGKYWLGCDVKTSLSGRPSKRRTLAGLGLHIDILIGDSFSVAARTAGMSSSRHSYWVGRHSAVTAESRLEQHPC